MQAISVKASSLAESRHTRLSSVFVCCFVSSFRRHSSVMYGSDSRPSACNTRGGGGGAAGQWCSVGARPRHTHRGSRSPPSQNSGPALPQTPHATARRPAQKPELRRGRQLCPA